MEETTGRSRQAAASLSGGGSDEVKEVRGPAGAAEKKNKNEQEERGLKMSTDDWNEFSKELRAGAERRAEENKRAKVGEDLNNDAMMVAIGGVVSLSRT